MPEGEHSPGLKSVLRHINSAVRHFRRSERLDPDCFTDCIYRTNQAFEGCLKEAYRVLAGLDPSEKKTFEIENYLEKQGILRSRVLIHFKRYRQDYRNPSTHDHRLDFDENEALLAIVSVVAFCKLLTDQISSKVRCQKAAESALSSSEPATAFATENNFTKYITEFVLKFISENVGDYHSVDIFAFEEQLSWSLSALGIQVESISQGTLDSKSPWVIKISHSGFSAGLEIRWSDTKHYSGFANFVESISSDLKHDSDVNSAIAVIISSEAEEYSLHHIKLGILLISKLEESDLNDLGFR